MLLALTVLFALALIIIAIIKYDIHPFLALFVGAIVYGLLAGMSPDLILTSITDGFGGVLGKIGLVILLGVIIGTFLEKTGGAFVIALRVLAWIGEKSVLLAMMITGWILSIPVFGDSAFIMMNPISKSLAIKGKLPYAATTVALTLGVTATHSLVPPTPGPIAAAGILGANLGMVIFWGIIVSSVALIPCFFFVKYYVTRFHLEPLFVPGADTAEIKKYPSLGKAALPIIVPLLLIVLASIASYPSHPFGQNTFTSILTFMGNPVIALLLGVFMSFALPEKFDRQLLSSTGWIGDSLMVAAPVILITGAGGVFGKMLQNSGIAELVTNNLSGANWGLLLPFLMALALKTAQGSSTVAMITTASIVAPLLPALGLDTETLRVFAVLAIGAGAIAISHANDSFFWAMTQLTGMNIKVGNQTHSLGTLILALSSIVLIYIITFFI
ncbi:permease [Adhaeribacter aerolatus]|uniref:Permease n=1 Tax=Adhaeribacter aerolatus TaxID=670289 RepID=A0A512AXD6_9BACT|nr:GntP family permease [Adhaeribacter aerolatus]GEO04373.1 permease [Adhaeribacter aerolatus]